LEAAQACVSHPGAHKSREKRNVELNPGDLFVVPRGIEHCPVAAEEVAFMIIEPSVTSAESDWI